MALQRIGEWENPIVNEADRPNRSAQEMKEIFDANSNQIKDAFNANMEALELAAETVQLDPGHPDRFLSADGTYKTPQVGEAANGVAAGGTAGQVYVKKSATDYDGEWKSIRPVVDTVTLPGTAWGGTKACTLTVSGLGIKADSVIFIKPAEADYEEWTISAVRGTGSGTDELTFACDDTPGDLDIEITVWNY